MALPFLATYRDLIEHLLGYADALSIESQQRRVRSAIQIAYRDFAQCHDWQYYKQHDRLQLYAAQSDGTVAYTASTKTVTLTGATWPSWSRYGQIKFSGDSNIYRVAELAGDGTLTLETRFAPTADIDAGTTYTLWRSTYPLPGDLLRTSDILDQSNWNSRGYVTPEQWMALERRVGGTQTPFAWTIMGSPELYGQLQLCVHGYPATDQTIDFIYRRSARALKLDGYARYSSQSGSRVSSIVGNTVTLSTAVEPDVVAAVFRASVSGATTNPESEDSVNAYLWQMTIYDRPTTTTLTLFDIAPTGYTAGAYYTISDPVDVAPYMYNALLKRCEYELLSKTEPSRAQAFHPLMVRALKEAMERDHTMPAPDGATKQYPWILPGYISPTAENVGGTSTPLPPG